MTLAVVLGLGLRCCHYLRGPSMWHDEAALVLNVINNGYHEMFGPLLFGEAAPPIFLVVERLVTEFLGDSLWALRLVPFLASCAALVLLVPVAQRILSPAAAVWAVFLFACSDRLLWHGCEAKPYAIDVLVAVGMLALLVGGAQGQVSFRVVALTALAPIVIWLSFPGCFLYGGVLLALLPMVGATRSWKTWLRYGVLAATVFASFAALALGPVRAQRCDAMTSCWLHAFPPYDQPWHVPWWIVNATLNIGGYCLKPIGAFLTPLALIGSVVLYRTGCRAWLAALLGPMALALAAALLQSYPYSGDRVLIYAAPAWALLVAAGAGNAIPWLRDRRPWLATALTLVLLIPLVRCGVVLVRPWHRIDSTAAAAYVQAHLAKEDQVIGNFWDYDYHFRKQRTQYRSDLSQTMIQRHLASSAAARTWLLLSSDVSAERRRLAEALLPATCQIVETREFTGTTVHLLTLRQ